MAEYGQLIVDECHHLSAQSFEQVARRAKAKFVLGLSATVARKDGHHPIIFMQCGPVRHVSTPRGRRPRTLSARGTGSSHAVSPAAAGRSRCANQFQDLYAELIADEAAQSADLR